MPYDSINADISRTAAAEKYVIFLMTSPYEVGKDISETFITTPQNSEIKNEPSPTGFHRAIARPQKLTNECPHFDLSTSELRRFSPP